MNYTKIISAPPFSTKAAAWLQGSGAGDAGLHTFSIKPDTEETGNSNYEAAHHTPAAASRRPAGGRRVLAQADPGCPGWRGGAARAICHPVTDRRIFSVVYHEDAAVSEAEAGPSYRQQRSVYHHHHGRSHSDDHSCACLQLS